MSDLTDLVARLATSENLDQGGETGTRQAAVLPVLEALGWNWRDLEEVEPEFAVSGGRVDYCLRSGTRELVFIEVKRAGTDLTSHQEQLLEYAFRDGVPLAALTEGRTWWLYLPTEEGSWEQRKFFSIDFRRQQPESAAESLKRFLAKEAVVAGDAVQRAKVEFRGQARERRTREALPRAWQELLTGPDELLAELLAEAVEGISGHRPDAESVARFLLQCAPASQGVAIAKRKAAPDVAPEPHASRSPVAQYTG